MLYSLEAYGLYCISTTYCTYNGTNSINDLPDVELFIHGNGTNPATDKVFRIPNYVYLDSSSYS